VPTPDLPAPGVATAALDNARWCDHVCRAAGLRTSRDRTRWWSAGRTPDGYPDVVTLVPGLSADAVLDGIDAGPGASVKDSFADLDLSDAGFDVLVDACWIASPARADVPPAWLLTWSDAASGEAATIAPELAGVTSHVVPLVGRDAAGQVAASLLLTAGAPGAPGDAWPEAGALAGAVHVVTHAGDPEAVWRDLPGLVAGRLPEVRHLVGYELGADLTAATAAGFAVLGPLRVWLRTG